MSGENTLLSVSGMHSWRVKATRIQFGMLILSDEDMGRTTKAIYIRKVVAQPDFVVSVIFSTIEDRDAFWNWGIYYSNWVADPSNNVGPQPMRVSGPRSFDWYGVLVGGLAKNAAVKDVTWTMDLAFTGAQPVAGANFGTGAFAPSTFVDTTTNLSLLLPSTVTPAGHPTEDTLYDDPGTNPPLPVKGPN